MRIAYLANFEGYRGSDATEQHVKLALELLGHEVHPFQQGLEDDLAVGTEADALLFHHWDNVKALIGAKAEKKVCWTFDKVWGSRRDWVARLLPHVHRFFLTDGTYLRENQHPKLRLLRQGWGDHVFPVERPVALPKADVAFTGTLYESRHAWAAALGAKYAFSIVQNVFNADLVRLCAAVPIIVAPPFPSDDHYWSNRIYQVLGAGGFMLHPRLKGLADDGLEEDVHFAAYGDEAEMYRKIDRFLDDKPCRERIRLAGHEKVLRDLTFTKRVEWMVAML